MSVPAQQVPATAEERRKTAIKVLEILCEGFRLWYEDLGLRTDIILASDISTLTDQEYQVFEDLNDLSLDVNRILINLTYARNITVVTSDTGGTQKLFFLQYSTRALRKISFSLICTTWQSQHNLEVFRWTNSPSQRHPAGGTI